MCFEQLHESAKRNELLLVDGGMCHWHLRRDGQLTIREILSTKPGAGSKMLDILVDMPNAASIFAKCPVDLAANAWYAKKSFVCEGQETTPSGRILNLWRLEL